MLRLRCSDGMGEGKAADVCLLAGWHYDCGTLEMELDYRAFLFWVNTHRRSSCVISNNFEAIEADRWRISGVT